MRGRIEASGPQGDRTVIGQRRWGGHFTASADGVDGVGSHEDPLGLPLSGSCPRPAVAAPPTCSLIDLPCLVLLLPRACVAACFVSEVPLVQRRHPPLRPRTRRVALVLHRALPLLRSRGDRLAGSDCYPGKSHGLHGRHTTEMRSLAHMDPYLLCGGALPAPTTYQVPPSGPLSPSLPPLCLPPRVFSHRSPRAPRRTQSPQGRAHHAW